MMRVEWWLDLFRHRPGIFAVGLGVAMGGLSVLDYRLPILLFIGVVGALVSLYRPALLVPTLFGAILAEESGRLGTTIAGLPLTASKLVVLAMLGVVLVRGFTERRAIVEWLPTTTGYLAVIASMVFGIAVSAKVTSYQVVPTIGVVMLMVLAHIIPRLLDLKDLRWVLQLMTGVALLVLALSAFSADAVQSAVHERYSGAYQDPNMWAMSLLLITPLCVAYLAEEDNPIWVPFLVALVALMLLNVFQSLSRAGMLALVSVSPTIAWLVWRRRVSFGAALIVTLVALGSFVSTEVMLDRYATLVDPDLTEADGSLQLRALLAKTGIRIFMDHPFIGTGQGTFIEEAIRYTNGAAYMITHNTYLNIAAELGLVGIVAHAYFYFLILREALRGFLRAPTRRLRRLIAGYAAGLLAFGLMSITLNTMQFTMAYFMVAMGSVLVRASFLSQKELDDIGLGLTDRVIDESHGQSVAA